MSIKYFLNDPTTPGLITEVDLPVAPATLSFKIDGYRGSTDAISTLEHQAAMCHYSIVTAVNLMNSVLKTPITHWATVPTLYVEPRAGKQLNAYYDRKSLRYFYAMNPISKNMVYSVNSADVRLHELGHALLDALRPDLYNVQAFEIWAFHESFGDMHAIINFLYNDFALDYLLNETGNDICKDNSLSKIAEEMGQAVYDLTGGRNGNVSGQLRNAINSFKYVAPTSLPHSGKDDQLTAEPHSFSRILTGTWYEILCKIFDFNKKEGMDPKTALVSARNTLTSYTFNAIPNTPATIKFYDGFARALLVQDKLNDYKYNQLINDVFLSRNILTQSFKPMLNMPWEAFKLMIDPKDEVLEHPNVISVRTKDIEQLTLPDFMVNIEAPNDSYYEFDEARNCIDSFDVSPLELIDHTRECVLFLQDKGLIRSDILAPFEITNEGNLVRTHFTCFLNNGTNPTQPEYLKVWKPENNSGCGCSSKKPTCSNSAPNIITQANTRLSVSGCGGNNISSVGNATKFRFGNVEKTNPKC